jgi:hypothetical protein
MSIDLMQMIKSAATQQIMNKLGGSLGLDSGKTSKAFDTGAAAILGGILNKAQSADGARSVLDLAKNTDFSVLDKLGDLVGGSGASADQFQKMGGGILDSLLGGNKGGMLSVLAKALGMDSSMIGKLLSMIAPIVMGILGKQIKSQGLDVSGLTSLLGSQKKSIAGFLPNNLAGDLGFKSLLGNVDKMAGSAGNAARQVASAGEQAGGGLMKMLIPLLLILAVGFLIWKFLLSGDAGDAARKAAESGRNAVESAGDAAKDVLSNAKGAIEDVASGLPKFDMDLSALGESGNTLKSGFTEISGGLADLAKSSATEDSAKALVEKIGGLTGKIDGMGLDKLDGIGKSVSSKLIGAFLGSLDGLMEKIPAPLRAVVEPAIKSLTEKLNPFK